MLECWNNAGLVVTTLPFFHFSTIPFFHPSIFPCPMDCNSKLPSQRVDFYFERVKHSFPALGYRQFLLIFSKVLPGTTGKMSLHLPRRIC